MTTNFNITHWKLEPRTEYNILEDVFLGFYLHSKIFFPLIKKILTIQSIFPQDLDTIGKILFSSLNKSTKQAPRLNPWFTFLISLLFNLYSTFWFRVLSIVFYGVFFSVLNFDFQISCVNRSAKKKEVDSNEE